METCLLIVLLSFGLPLCLGVSIVSIPGPVSGPDFRFLPGLLSMALLSSLLGHNQDQAIQERELQIEAVQGFTVPHRVESLLPGQGPSLVDAPVSFLLVALGLVPGFLC